MKSGRGAIYTVDEVSDLLGIPRPTLYRYLREYSIPHLRRSGRISIPEDSFDLIREARDLHKEGLGTESVRRLLREGGAATTGELSNRLDTLSETLKDLQEKTAMDERVSSPALRTILARQSLLISAVFNLTEMVEDLLLANGQRRKTIFGELGGRLQGNVPLPEHTGRRELEAPGGVVTVMRPESRSRDGAGEDWHPAPARRGRFGHLSQRRRRGALALLSALVVFALLAGGISRPGGEQLLELWPSGGGQSEGSLAGSTPGDGGSRAGQASGDVQKDAEERAGTAAGEAGSVTVGYEEIRRGEVPDVTGLGVEEAARMVSRADLTVAAIRTVTSPEKAGTVTRTDPPAGATAQPGTPVILTMSGGPSGTPPASE